MESEKNYGIEEELCFANGSDAHVPEWARSAVKYFRHPKNHGLNLTIADFPPAGAPNAVERYTAWLEKKQAEEQKPCTTGILLGLRTTTQSED